MTSSLTMGILKTMWNNLFWPSYFFSPYVNVRRQLDVTENSHVTCREEGKTSFLTFLCCHHHNFIHTFLLYTPTGNPLKQNLEKSCITLKIEKCETKTFWSRFPTFHNHFAYYLTIKALKVRTNWYLTLFKTSWVLSTVLPHNDSEGKLVLIDKCRKLEAIKYLFVTPISLQVRVIGQFNFLCT